MGRVSAMMPEQATASTCDFCLSLSDNPVLGEIINSHGINVHINCLYTASGLVQRTNPDKLPARKKQLYIAGFDPDDVKLELRRGKRLRCKHCGVTGACVGCSNPKCRSSFHLPCLFTSKGFTVFKGAFKAYCFHHRPLQNLKPRLLSYTDDPPECCICLFGVIPDEDLESFPEDDVESSQKSGSEFSTPPTNTRKSVVIDNQQMSRFLTPASSKNGKRNSGWEVNASVDEGSSSMQTPVMRKSLRKPAWLRRLLREAPVAPLYTPATPKTPRASAHTMTPLEAWSHGVIHGGCCRPAWMHRDCAAGYARSAGLHHTKCPLCFDRDTSFIPTLLDFGIWIPDRDASWELEPGAFVYPEDPPIVEDAVEESHEPTAGAQINEETRNAEPPLQPARSVASSGSCSCQIIDDNIGEGTCGQVHEVQYVDSAEPSPPLTPIRVTLKRQRRRTSGATSQSSSSSVVTRRRQQRRHSERPVTRKVDKTEKGPSLAEKLEPQRLSAVLECSIGSEKENKRPSQTSIEDHMLKLSPIPVKRRLTTRRQRAHTTFIGNGFRQTSLSSFFQPIVIHDDDDDDEDDNNHHQPGSNNEPPESTQPNAETMKHTNALFRSMLNGRRPTMTRTSRYSLRSASGSASLA